MNKMGTGGFMELQIISQANMSQGVNKFPVVAVTNY